MLPFVLVFAAVLVVATIIFLVAKKAKKSKLTNPFKKNTNADNAEVLTQVGCTFDE